jgi:hypothetical protein
VALGEFLLAQRCHSQELVISDKLKHCSLTVKNRRGIAVPVRGTGAAQIFNGSRDI